MTVSFRQLIGLVVMLWIAVLCYDVMVTPLDAWVNGEQVDIGRNRELMFVVGAAFALTASLIIAKRLRQISKTVKRSVPALLLLFLSLLLIFLSVLQTNPSSIAYAILFGFTLVLTLYANQILPNRFYFTTGCILVCTLLALILFHGPPNGRWIGGVHPNTIGSFALAAVYFAARSRDKYRWLLYLVSMIFAGLISSRFAIVAIVIICLADYLTLIRLTPMRLVATAVFSIAAVLILATWWDFILSDIFEFYDPTRGVGSGMTGRADLSENFWGQFVESPLMGFGFRARDNYVPTHNGYLNFLLENGAIAFFILAATACTAIYRATLSYLSSRDPRYAMRIGFWLAWLFAGFLMPQLVNFGDTYATFSLFLLTDNFRNEKTSNVYST